jgi:hypothetical protein
MQKCSCETDNTNLRGVAKRDRKSEYETREQYLHVRRSQDLRTTTTGRVPACYGLDKLNIRVVGSDGPEEGEVALSFIRRHRLSGTDLGRPANNNSNTLHTVHAPIIDLIWFTLWAVPITRTYASASYISVRSPALIAM